ncbi:hypothetical protein D3C71_1053840 [compost metagenome]|jgi:hypothetical protein
MTTTVITQAHCASDKEVEVVIVNRVTGEVYEKFILQDGEQAQRVVYDDREIKVTEVLKSA